MENRKIAYWLTTGLFCLVLGFSGVAHFLHVEFIVESMALLGYPVYFMTILGSFKMLGVAALLAPRMPLLKEWAYAGFAFNLIGATASHLYAGEPFSHWIRPLAVLGIGVASYLLRPASRRLPDSVTLANATPGNAEAPAASPPLAHS
ncbi:MAG: DoxX family protein [Myxococcota bacterium]